MVRQHKHLWTPSQWLTVKPLQIQHPVMIQQIPMLTVTRGLVILLFITALSILTRQAIHTYVGAPTDGFVYNASTTGPSGYYSRKMCDATLSANSPGNTNRGWPLLRYGEILLIYAEAVNETGQTALAYPVLRQLRARAGIIAGADGNYGMNPNMDVKAMRAFIQNERHIELMYENTRWDDVRRWKIATTTQNGRNKLMQITKNTNGTYTYTVVSSFFLHSFNERNYLLPIQNSEIRKAPAMVQNPGW